MTTSPAAGDKAQGGAPDPRRISLPLHDLWTIAAVALPTGKTGDKMTVCDKGGNDLRRRACPAARSGLTSASADTECMATNARSVWAELGRIEGWGVGRCLSCHRSLCHVPENVCPDCGRPFDPADPRTMNMEPASGPSNGPGLFAKVLEKLKLRRP